MVMSAVLHYPERSKSLLSLLDGQENQEEEGLFPPEEEEEEFVPYSQRPETSMLIEELQKMGVAIVDAGD